MHFGLDHNSRNGNGKIWNLPTNRNLALENWANSRADCFLLFADVWGYNLLGIHIT